MAGRRAVVANTALLVAVLAFCALGGAQAACRVRLELDGAASPVVLTGTNALSRVGSTSTPLSSDSKFEANVPRAWTGSLYAYAALLAACPTDRAGWVTAWPQFVLTSATSPSTYSPPLQLWPALHTGKVRRLSFRLCVTVMHSLLFGHNTRVTIGRSGNLCF